MKGLILWITEEGRLLAEKLVAAGVGEKRPFDREEVKRAFVQRIPLIFIGACGIAVRTVAPYLRHKSVDPPVLVIDEQGNFVISLLSGHLGGANAWAQEVAEKIGATPVITTASDQHHLPALDSWLSSCGALIKDWQTLKKLQSKFLKEKSLKVFCVPPLKRTPPSPMSLASCPEEADLILTYQDLNYEKPHLVVKALYLGLGFHEEEENLIFKVLQFLKERNISQEAVRVVATLEKRQKNPAFWKLAEKLGAEVRFFSEEALRKTNPPSPSCARKALNVPGVAEPCALLSSEGGTLLVPKTVYAGITVAVALK